MGEEPYDTFSDDIGAAGFLVKSSWPEVVEEFVISILIWQNIGSCRIYGFQTHEFYRVGIAHENPCAKD